MLFNFLVSVSASFLIISSFLSGPLEPIRHEGFTSGGDASFFLIYLDTGCHDMSSSVGRDSRERAEENEGEVSQGVRSEGRRKHGIL